MEKISREMHQKFEANYIKAKNLASTIKQEWILIQKARQGNIFAEKMLYYLNYPLLIKYINNKTIRYNGSMVDLLGVAYQGLRRAIQLYDPTYKVHFSAVFIPYALSKVRDFLMVDKLVYVPEAQVYKKNYRIDISSLNTCVDGHPDLEKINCVTDENSDLVEASDIEHLKYDIKKIIDSAPDKEKLNKIYKAIYEGPEKGTIDYLKQTTGLSNGVIQFIRKRTLKHIKANKYEY